MNTRQGSIYHTVRLQWSAVCHLKGGMMLDEAAVDGDMAMQVLQVPASISYRIVMYGVAIASIMLCCS